MAIVYGHSVGWANTPNEFRAELSDSPANTLEIRGYDRGREYWYAPNKQSVSIEVDSAGVVTGITDLSDGSSWGGFSLGHKGQISVGKKLP